MKRLPSLPGPINPRVFIIRSHYSDRERKFLLIIVLCLDLFHTALRVSVLSHKHVKSISALLLNLFVLSEIMLYFLYINDVN